MRFSVQGSVAVAMYTGRIVRVNNSVRLQPESFGLKTRAVHLIQLDSLMTITGCLRCVVQSTVTIRHVQARSWLVRVESDRVCEGRLCLGCIADFVAES